MKELKDMSLEELWQLFPIVLQAYNPDYGIRYDAEKESLLRLLKEYDVCRINHIGSTAVEGLIAKPIIDILLELSGDYDIDAFVALLEGNEWILMAEDRGEKTLSLNKGYTPNGFAESVYHLHVKPAGDWDALYFRDYLQSHPLVARQYGVLKLELRERFEHDRDAYTDAKTDFIAKYTQKAREEFGGRYAIK